MKQKIVMKVQMTCGKCRTKAMKIAAVADGVISVAIEGPEKDKVVVIGDGVDTACLVQTMKKKVAYTTLISVEEVKPKPPEKEEEKKEEKKVVVPTPPIQCCPNYTQYPQCPNYDYVCYDPNPRGCSIM